MKLTGRVEDIIFHSEESGYTVLTLSHDEELDTVAGTLPLIQEGAFATFTGEFCEHPIYGTQFRATGCSVEPPRGAEAIQQFLSAGIVRGIGPKTAKLIVNCFGDRTLEVLEKDPDALAQVHGIGPKRAAEIRESYLEVAESQRTIMFLQEFGIEVGLARRIFARFGDTSVFRLQTNPYSLVGEVDGIGFLTADRIASALGVARDSEYRLSEGIRFCLLQAGNEGHTFLPQPLLLARAAQLLQVPADTVSAALVALAARQGVILNSVEGTSAVYHPSFFFAEAQSAGMLLKLRDSAVPEEEGTVAEEIVSFERANDMMLAPLQKQAVTAALTKGVCVITGGPGTGKTTALKCLLSLFHRRGKKVALCAPTGRAAKRMSDAVGEEAATIHRLLEYTRTEEESYRFRKNEEDPLVCDVCITDETSMIDIFLLEALLKALRPGTFLVFVGDADQLPSVGAGNVLRDILSSGVFPVVQLTEVFRQAAESTIIRNAHRINRGEAPQFNLPGGDFFLQRMPGESEIAGTVMDLCSRRLPEHYGVDPMKGIQVLSPIKRGTAGVFNLNKLLQQALNPPESGKPEYLFGETVFRAGDKVMQIKNDYSRRWVRVSDKGVLTDGEGVYNGDVGIVIELSKDDRSLKVLFEDGRSCEYEFGELEALSLAYCISVHKSQGCEFPFVVLAMPPQGGRIMNRNLFYTAVTRARDLVVLVGSEKTVNAMVRNTETRQRYSALGVRLRMAAQLLATPTESDNFPIL